MNPTINELRTKLDKIDRNLIELLAKRFDVTRQVGEYKKANNLPPVDKNREAFQFDRIDKLAKEMNLNPEFAQRFLRLVIDEVVKNHKEIMSRK